MVVVVVTEVVVVIMVIVVMVLMVVVEAPIMGRVGGRVQLRATPSANDATERVAGERPRCCKAAALRT